MLRQSMFAACAAALLLLAACTGKPATETAAVPAAADTGPPPRAPILATLTSPPNVPPPIRRDHPARVIVNLDVVEKTMPIADGSTYTFWTFGGTVPGSFIRVRQGDTLEIHLRNPSGSAMPHSIDLHAVSGPGGGMDASETPPGHESQFSFKALHAGLYVYHCATMPAGMHIANGMYGLILVEPPGGLPEVDREYYVMQGDFYTAGAYRAKGHQAFDMQKAVAEQPTYVLFNGREGALTGANALAAKTGQTVRLYVGNGGPNLSSSFHVIGEIFGKVWQGGFAHALEDMQTVTVPPGSAVTVQFRTPVPGTYTMVDHAIFRALSKGAVGQLVVSGADNPLVYSGRQASRPYTGAAAPEIAQAPAAGVRDPLANGRRLFGESCAACHQANGEGVPSMFPPLAKSSVLAADPKRAIDIALHGLRGPLTVNGLQYDAVMPSMGHLADAELAEILTYVLNSWGNPGGRVTGEDVARVRKAGPGGGVARGVGER